MGGNKTLKKFKDSKVPKKGGGIANETIPIYAEPNTYSKVIGYIKKGQKLYWDRKSISQDNEWVNFGPEHQCGYMIGINKDGKYNIVPESIVEKKEEKKKDEFKTNPIKLTPKEMQIVNDACKDLRLELGFKPIELKNYVIEDDSMNDTKDTTTEETPTEETPKVYGLDDLKEDEKDQYLSNAFNYPNIFEIGKIKEENQKLAQEIMNNFSKMEDDESKKKILDDALSIVTQTKQESKIIPNIPRNLLTVCNYSCEFLTQASVKILSLTYIKYVWLDYPKTLNKIEAKIIVCRINSTTLSSQSFISKVYKATGLATASLDCFINCLKIMDNNNYSDEEKCKEILKNIGGETGAYVGVNKLAKSKMIKKLKKATKTIFKSFAKILKFGSKTNIITAVAGLALDCVVSYFTGDAIDTLCEEIIDKIFDAITD